MASGYHYIGGLLRRECLPQIAFMWPLAHTSKGSCLELGLLLGLLYIYISIYGMSYFQFQSHLHCRYINMYRGTLLEMGHYSSTTMCHYYVSILQLLSKLTKCPNTDTLIVVVVHVTTCVYSTVHARESTRVYSAL